MVVPPKATFHCGNFLSLKNFLTLLSLNLWSYCWNPLRHHLSSWATRGKIKPPLFITTLCQNSCSSIWRPEGLFPYLVSSLKLLFPNKRTASPEVVTTFVCVCWHTCALRVSLLRIRLTYMLSSRLYNDSVLGQCAIEEKEGSHCSRVQIFFLWHLFIQLPAPTHSTKHRGYKINEADSPCSSCYILANHVIYLISAVSKGYYDAMESWWGRS